MLRAIANSVLSLLLLITLLWGGCISCPQFFMSPRPDAAKDCCKAGRCERSQSNPSAPAKECKRMPLTPAASAHVHAELPVSAIIIPADPLPPVVAYVCGTARVAMFVEHSPPDLQVLNATFLI